MSRAPPTSQQDSPNIPAYRRDYAMLYCPACSEPYCAPPNDAAAVSLSCGHSFCKLCAEAMAASAAPTCMACAQSVFADVYYNHAVSWLVDSMYEASRSRKTPKRVPVPDQNPSGSACSKFRVQCPDNSVVEQLQLLMEKCTNGVAIASKTADSLQNVQAGMTQRFIASKQRVLDAVEALKASIDAKCRELIVEATAAHDVKVKALQAQRDCAVVTAGQLSTTVEACRHAIEQGSQKMMEDVVLYGTQVTKLMDLPSAPCTTTLIEVVPTEWLQSLEDVHIGFIRCRLSSDCRVSGRFLSAFVSGDGEDGVNTGRIELRDERDCLLRSVDPDDVTVCIRPMQDVGNADVKSSEVVSVMNVQRCEESGDHTLDFTFVVRDATVSAIDIAITAYGHDVFHRQVTSGLQARGGLVRTLVPGGPQSESDSHQTLTSFAVSDDASQLAVVFDRCKAVFVYSLPGCDLLHSFGVGDLHGNFEFIQPVHVTSVPGTTHWLVCDNGGHRVIEVTNTGGLVTCYLVNMPTAAVSDGTSVVVARQPVALPNYSTLELYSNGHFVNAFDWYGKVSSLSIFPARYQLDTILPGLAVESHRGTVFLLNDGAVVLANGEVTQPSNEREVTCLGTVATSLGHMASLEHHGNTVEVVVRDCASGGAVRRWQTASSFMKHAPPQLQATSCHLYVSDPSTGGIHVFA